MQMSSPWDDALKALEQIDPRKSPVVELRFFGGLSIEENGRSSGYVGPNGEARLDDGEGCGCFAN
jgi:hypothetical protein